MRDKLDWIESHRVLLEVMRFAAVKYESPCTKRHSENEKLILYPSVQHDVFGKVFETMRPGMIGNEICLVQLNQPYAASQQHVPRRRR